jgi:hypothetical protein
MKPETVDISWVEDVDKSVSLVVQGGKGLAGEAAREKVKAAVSEALKALGFRLDFEGEPDLVLTLSLRIKKLSDERFLERGTPVRAAIIDATLKKPGEDEPYLRRLGASKPEWGETESQAVTRAAQDAWNVLSTHVIEALAIY